MTNKEQKWKNKIAELEVTIQNAREEITNIQRSCNHNEYRIGTYSWRIACYDLVRICNICGLPLTFGDSPTEEELEEFHGEDNDGQGKKVYKRETD